ncbi:MAG: carboxypeptidase-like regulatory domain-containing protein [Chitinophagaceae bacterium]
MKYWLSIVTISLLFTAQQVAAQKEREVSIIGRVYDADTHEPLYRATVMDISIGTGTQTDSAGFYKISAFNNNNIVFSYLGYFSDTSIINPLLLRQRLDIPLHKNKYSIAPVEIIGHRPDYSYDSAQRRYWFAPALNEQKVRGLNAVEHPISALYDALSGRQKRLWRFQKDYQQYEERMYIESRVRPGQIEMLFGLKGDSLNAFMIWYNPPYLFVRNATDYQLLEDVKHAIELFRHVYKPVPALVPEDDKN